MECISYSRNVSVSHRNVNIFVYSFMILLRIFSFFGSEEFVWSEITNPFLDSPKKTPPRQISSKVRQLMRWVYKTSVSHFKVKNTPLKDTGGKGRFKRMLNFLLMDKGRLFFTESSEKFEIHEIFITADRSAWPVLKRNQAAKFLKNFQIRFVLYSQ